MRLRSDPVTLLEGSSSAGVGVPGGEAAGGGQGLAPSTAQVTLQNATPCLPHTSTDRVGYFYVGVFFRGVNGRLLLSV